MEKCNPYFPFSCCATPSRNEKWLKVLLLSFDWKTIFKENICREEEAQSGKSWWINVIVGITRNEYVIAYKKVTSTWQNEGRDLN